MTTKRSTAAHVNGRAIERAENLKLLIAELATRDMMREDISNFLNFSPSGARKYVTELREAGLIEVAGLFGAKGRYAGLPIWHLVDDADLVQTFLNNLAAKPKRVPTSRCAPSAPK